MGTSAKETFLNIFFVLYLEVCYNILTGNYNLVQCYKIKETKGLRHEKTSGWDQCKIYTFLLVRSIVVAVCQRAVWDSL